MGIFKRIFPSSLFYRFLLIILLPALLVQVIAVHIFYERHWESVRSNLASSLGGEIAAIVNIAEQYPEPVAYPIFSQLNKTMHLQIATAVSKKLPEKRLFESEALEVLDKALAKNITYPYHVDFTDSKSQNIEITVRLPGYNLQITAPSKRLQNPTTYIFIMWMVGSAVLLFFVALLFLRGQIRSILRMVAAANALGKGQDLTNYKPHGAKEIRRAASSLLQMKERLSRHISERTMMLAGISHDLRTPLTRMRLQLALLTKKIGKQAVNTMESDIAEMEQMLQSYLDYAKGEGTEKPTNISVDGFVTKTLESFSHAKGRLSYRGLKGKPLYLMIRYHAMRRAFINVIENALRHADKVEVRVEARRRSGLVNIFIDDNGPGIPADKREDVFKPFQRLDTSRNQKTGGSGLGLAIARDIVTAHGGTITLSDSPLGGLRVLIQLPL